MVGKTHSGSCLCGAVVFEVNGPLRDVIACHCSQCRKTTGHFMPASAAKHEHFRLVTRPPCLVVEWEWVVVWTTDFFETRFIVGLNLVRARFT